MMREQNGHIDDGKPIRGGRKVCPNCKSTNYIETLSREKCNNCGLECDYWGAGANKVYQNYTNKKYAEEDRRREAALKAEIDREASHYLDWE